MQMFRKIDKLTIIKIKTNSFKEKNNATWTHVAQASLTLCL